MSGEDIDSILSSMTLDDAKVLRKKLTKNIKSMRKSKNLSLTVYVQAEYRDSFEIAKKWAHEKGLTKKPSNWAFAKFCLINTIKIVLDEIERERNAPPVSECLEEEADEPIIA